MFQHSLASSTLRRTRTAVTAAALAMAAIGPVVGIASPALASGPTTFSNSTALTVADGQPPCGSGCTPGLASTYPSPITVSGMAGTLSNMTVTLTGVTHAYTSDFDVLLTGPGGQKFILASDAGNNGGSSNATVTFSDAGAGAPSYSSGWGNGSPTYKPFNFSGDPDVWPSPAPAGPYSNADNGTAGSGSLNTTTFASVFNGTSPNGVWNLYVVDDAFSDVGSISGGWSMSLTTAAAAATLTTASTSASPISTGAPLTLSAHVTQASDSSNVTAGTVTFSDGSTVLGAPVAVNGAGVASTVTSSLAEGTHTITAAYTGNASFGNSSGAVSQVVDHPTTQAGNTYCNSGPLTLNDGSVGSSTGATPYPSHIVISGQSGGLSALTVNLVGVTAAFADDLDVELVGPLGQKFMLASDAGGGVAISGASVTFDDNAAGTFAAATGGWASGAVKPVDYNTGTDVMPAPAPSGWSSAAPTGAATLTSVFGGSSANGTWSLYVADDSIDGSAGSISSGWCLGTTSNTDPATTTVLTSSVNPTALGGSTTFSAHVTATSGGANVTVGTVTFRNGSNVIGSAQALSGTGTASVATSALTEGSHTITATYSGVGGSFNLSSATLTQTVNGVTTVAGSTFCNAGGITVNDPPGAGQIGAASPYASHIVVSGITGNLSNLTVAVKAISHATPDDMDILLVGPGGQALKLASDAGGLVAISNLNVTFDDAAASSLPDSSSWGSGVITAKPTDYNDGTDSFPTPAPVSYGSPAPAGSATLSSTFAGTSPNGTWNLYVVDDSLGQTGTIGSWCLTVGIPASAAADTYTAGMDTALTVPAPGVLSNDSGFPAPTVSAHDAVTTQGGIVSMATNGGFTYTPPSSFTGDDTFTYTASNGSTSVGTVTIHVTHIPVVSGATLSRQQGTAANSSSIATVSDAETAAGSLVVTTGSSTGISLSGVTNTAGTVSGTVGAACTATTGAHTIAVHATDADGFTGNGTLTVNVTPNTGPVLTYGSLAANSGGGTTGDTLTGPSDNGSVAALAIQSVTPAFTGTITVDGPATGAPGRIHVSNAGPSGTYTVTVRATDNCADTTDVPVTLTVNGAPTVDAGSDDTTSQLAGPFTLSGIASDDGLAPGTGLVTTWSQISGPGTASFDDSHSLTAAATFDVGGIYVLQLSATDGQLTSTDTVAITVNEQPSITVPSDITVGESSPGAGANVPFTVTATGFPTPTVSCLDGTTAVASGDHFAAGVHTIACLADNVAGSAGGSFTITVNSSPVITVPADITVNEASPGAGLAVTFSVTATGVPAPSIACFEGSTSVTSGDTFAVGSHTISCTATNGSGTDTKTFHIIVRSVPVITVPASFSVLESPAGSGHAAVPFTVTATGFPTPTVGCLEGSTSVVSGDTFTAGVHTVDCTATNGAGADTASFTITVDTVPVITVPSDITVNESSPGAGRAVTFSVTATGLPTPSIACLDGSTAVASGDIFDVGSHTISCTATSTSGTDTKTFHIIVRSLPVITVPASFSVLESPAGSGHAAVAFTVTATGFPTPTIGCLEGSTVVASGDTFATGAHTIDCTATNGAGTDSGSFVLTVKSGPVVTVPSAITVTEASAGGGASVPFTVTATGVPAPAVVCVDGSTTVHSGDTFAAGVHTVSCTATNTVGTDTKSFTITVRSLPVLTVPASFTAIESPVGSGTASVPFTATATGTPAPAVVCKIGSTTVVSPVTLAIGAHQIDCVATNVVGTDSKSFTVTVVPGNHAPAAHAGGPYSVVEGHSLALSAASSTDVDGDTLTYSWDVNGDGVFGDAVGVAPTLTWAQLGALGIGDGPATFGAKVRVDDNKAAPVTSAAAAVTVVNAAPAGSIAGEAHWATGLTVSLTFAGTDPSAGDQAAGFGYMIRWGDGATSGPVHAGSSLVKTHTYAAAGGYTVTLTVADKDGAVSEVVSKTLTVAVVTPDVCGSGKTLLVGGTSGDDVITLSAGPTSSTIEVVVNGVSEPVAVGFTRVVVNAGAGNDKVTFTGGPTVKRLLYGGAGNDTLVSGNGPAVLVGGGGADLLTGGSQRDVLIGGAGADVEHGAAGDDILLDGATSFDAFTITSEKALCGIQAEWTRTDVSFAGRVAHLLGHGHGSRSSTHFILSGPHRNVFTGGDKDLLDGGSGQNWYLGNFKGKGVHDKVLHQAARDRVTDL